MQLTMVRRIVGAILAMAILVMAVATADFGPSDYTVTAEFARTPGLYAGNEVVVLGVPVGKVASVEPHGDQVTITMKITGETKVPADADAVLLPRSVVTDRVIELSPAFTGGPALADGDEIPIRRSHTPVEFQEVVAAVDNLSAELGRLERGSGAVESFMDVAANNARGNGQRLRDTLHGLQATVAGFSRERGNTVLLVRQLAQLLHVMAMNDDVVQSFSETLTETTDMLSGEGTEINAALRDLLDSLRDVAGFVTAHRDGLQKGIDGLGDAATVYGRRGKDLTEIVDTLGLMAQNIYNAVDPSGKLRVHADLNENVLRTDVVAGFCRNYTQLPICEGLDLDVGPDLGLTERLTGSLP